MGERKPKSLILILMLRSINIFEAYFICIINRLLLAQDHFVSEHPALDPCHHQSPLRFAKTAASFLVILRCSIGSTLLSSGSSGSWQALLKHDICWSACEQHEQQPTQQHQQPRSYETRHHLQFSWIMKESLYKI